jgi:hypothetical protein
MLYPEYAAGIRIPLDIAATYYIHWLEGGYMNEACANALGPKRAQCWDVDVLQPYLRTSLFVAQNQFDSEQVCAPLLLPAGWGCVGLGRDVVSRTGPLTRRRVPVPTAAQRNGAAPPDRGTARMQSVLVPSKRHRKGFHGRLQVAHCRVTSKVPRRR